MTTLYPSAFTLYNDDANKNGVSPNSHISHHSCEVTTFLWDVQAQTNHLFITDFPFFCERLPFKSQKFSFYALSHCFCRAISVLLHRNSIHFTTQNGSVEILLLFSTDPYSRFIYDIFVFRCGWYSPNDSIKLLLYFTNAKVHFIIIRDNTPLRTILVKKNIALTTRRK